MPIKIFYYTQSISSKTDKEIYGMMEMKPPL